VTGGAGFYTVAVCVALLSAGERVVVFDNFRNSSPEASTGSNEFAASRWRQTKATIATSDALEAY
jgi:UDP-glucose 4-epimerase